MDAQTIATAADEAKGIREKLVRNGASRRFARELLRMWIRGYTDQSEFLT